MLPTDDTDLKASSIRNAFSSLSYTIKATESKNELVVFITSLTR